MVDGKAAIDALAVLRQRFTLLDAFLLGHSELRRVLVAKCAIAQYRAHKG